MQLLGSTAPNLSPVGGCETKLAISYILYSLLRLVDLFGYLVTTLYIAAKITVIRTSLPNPSQIYLLHDIFNWQIVNWVWQSQLIRPPYDELMMTGSEVAEP